MWEDDDPLISRAFDACMAIVSASLPSLKRRPVDKCIDGPCSAYLKKHQAEPASLLACWALHRLCVSSGGGSTVGRCREASRC